MGLWGCFQGQCSKETWFLSTMSYPIFISTLV